MPREDFSGPPPWLVSGGHFGLRRETDLAAIYDDVLVAIDSRKGINNGQPSLHAQCIAALALQAGERIAHIGAGAGYYTAILARLVGASGKVFAYEIEPEIAERARTNLARYPQVEVLARNGIEGLPPVDCIYVNAAASYPIPGWLEALNVGGRLLFPMHAAHSSGAMLLVTRPPGGGAWPARFLTASCSSPARGRRIRASMAAWTRPSAAAAQARCARCGSAAEAKPSDWLRGDGWALSTEEPGRGLSGPLRLAAARPESL